MEGDLLSLGMEVMQAVNEISPGNYGPTTESNLQIRMNEIDEEAGIGVKGQVIFSGPTLDKLKEHGSVLFPDRTDEDFFVIVSVRTKGNPQEFIDEVEGIISSYGLPMDMVEQFGEIKFHAGDGEALIGFKATDNPISQMAKSFTVKPSVFGDGTQDITVDFSVNLGTTFTDMLGDEPLFTYFLKAASIHAKSYMHTRTRENILKVLAEKKEQLDHLINMFPFAIPLVLFKKMDCVLDLQCTDEMVENMRNTLQNANPMSSMSLKEVFGIAKAMGIPLDMFQPIFELIQSKTAGEISVSGVASTGYKVTLRLPGLDQAIAAFLAA